MTTDVGGGCVTDMALQPDGQIVVAGSAGSGSAIACYMPGANWPNRNRQGARLCVWDGGSALNNGGGDNLWSDPDNWVGGSAPITGDELEFTGSAHTTYDDFPDGTAFQSIDVAAPGFTLSGDAFAVTDGITVDAGVGGRPRSPTRFPALAR